MSVADFADLMPHRIRVKTAVQLDDYGYPIGTAKDLVYVCLLDDSVEVEYTQSGPRSVIVHKAYVNPYPILDDGSFSENAAVITAETKIWTPDDDQHEIVAVATHYDVDGLPHNQELTFN